MTVPQPVGDLVQDATGNKSKPERKADFTGPRRENLFSGQENDCGEVAVNQQANDFQHSTCQF